MKSEAKMNWTGERYTPGSVFGDIEVEHWHRYLLAAESVAGKDVLDIASGEGYGSHYLSQKANSVIGVDISIEAVEFANQKYSNSRLKYIQGSCQIIPLADATVDVVVSFETIEHHPFHEKMIEEIKRVLRPGGLLIISSPDKLNYSDIPATVNEHHVKELYKEEFEALLAKSFRKVEICGQKLFSGSIIIGSGDKSELPNEPTSSFYEINSKFEQSPWIKGAVYLIAFASDQEIPTIKYSLFESKAKENSLNPNEEGILKTSIAELESRCKQLEANAREQHLERLRFERELAAILTSRSWKIITRFKKLKKAVLGQSAP